MSKSSDKIHKPLIDPLLPIEDGLTDPLLPPDEPDKGFEEKKYLVLWVMNDDSSEYGNHFFIGTGRTETYYFLRDNITEIDIHNSYVLVETKQTETKSKVRRWYMTSIDKAITVYQFLKKIQDNYNDKFDVEDYDYTFEDNEENRDYISNNNMDFNMWNQSSMLEIDTSSYQKPTSNSDEEDMDENDI